MNINAIGPTVTSTPANSTSSTAKVDQDMFLKLLVAQLKNQDPLAPQDSTQFVAQLATFSSLDQLIGIKDLLSKAVDSKSSTTAK
jgi:flagellar basal-body rod modification protein FlgD